LKREKERNNCEKLCLSWELFGASENRVQGKILESRLEAEHSNQIIS